LCELSVARGVDPSANGNQAVQWAAEKGHLDVVRYLCELPADRGVDPSADGNQAVMFAIVRGHLKVVRYLCDLPFSRGVAELLSEEPTPADSTRHGGGSYRNTGRVLADLRQQALASSARLPLLMLRALVRHHRGIHV